MGKFKVPTLRNVDRRPSPGFVKAYGHNRKELGNLGLTDPEEHTIEAFLGTLTDGYVPEK